jgi:uncharacterized protein
MVPSLQEIERLHRKYAPNDVVYDLVYGHCQTVCEIALWAAETADKVAPIDKPLLQAACLLHDIGTYAFFSEDGKVVNHRLYPQHAIFGAKILADEGMDGRIAQLVETHVLCGLTKEDIVNAQWPLPARDYVPHTTEGELLCYADRFHSKHPTFNAYETFLAGLEKRMPTQAAKFQKLAGRFGVPDISALAEKYGQPVR